MLMLFGTPLEAVIFDYDGVLADINKVMQKNLEQAAIRTGLSIYPIDNYIEGIRSGSILGVPVFHRMVKYIWPTMTDGEADEFLHVFSEVEKSNYPPAFPGSVPLIAYLRAHGVMCTLCTNNPNELLERKLAVAGISRSFFHAVATSDCGFVKPDPRILESLLQGSLKTIPRVHIIYVGDWYPDFEVARVCGVRFVAVTSGGLPERIFAELGVSKEYIINNVGVLLDILRKENQF